MTAKKTETAELVIGSRTWAMHQRDLGREVEAQCSPLDTVDSWGVKDPYHWGYDTWRLKVVVRKMRTRDILEGKFLLMSDTGTKILEVLHGWEDQNGRRVRVSGRADISQVLRKDEEPVYHVDMSLMGLTEDDSGEGEEHPMDGVWVPSQVWGSMAFFDYDSAESWARESLVEQRKRVLGI